MREDSPNKLPSGGYHVDRHVVAVMRMWLFMFVASYLQDIKSLPYLLGAWLIYDSWLRSNSKLGFQPGTCSIRAGFCACPCRSAWQASVRMTMAAAGTFYLRGVDRCSERMFLPLQGAQNALSSNSQSRRTLGPVSMGYHKCSSSPRSPLTATKASSRRTLTFSRRCERVWVWASSE